MREFWRQVIWYLGHPTEPYSSRVVGYSDGVPIEAEHTEDGLPIGHVRCAQYTLKCQRCDVAVKAWVPLYMSSESVSLMHIGTAHLVTTAQNSLELQE